MPCLIPCQHGIEHADMGYLEVIRLDQNCGAIELGAVFIMKLHRIAFMATGRMEEQGGHIHQIDGGLGW